MILVKKNAEKIISKCLLSTCILYEWSIVPTYFQKNIV